jgi:hypothetical protein
MILLGSLAGGPSSTPTATATSYTYAAPKCADQAACDAANKAAYANVGKEPIIVSFAWEKGGFGVVMVLSKITITNPKTVPIADFRITCDLSGPSGTRVGSVSTVLYERIDAGKTRTFRNVNVGFIHGQSSGASCRAHAR